MHGMRALIWLPLALVAGAPNIIYVVIDDLDQMLGSSFPETHGTTPLPKTRRLLVDEGATFTNAFAHVPICNPSRSCTLTGRYFHNLKATDALRAMHVDMDKVHDFSFAVDFKRAGYATGLFGKYANAMPESGTVPRGWDAWFANDGGTYFDPSFWSRGVPDVPDGRFHAEGYSTAIIGNASVAFLERELARQASVLLHVGPKAVHAPFLPAPWHADVWYDDWPSHAPRHAWNLSFAQLSEHASNVRIGRSLSAAAVRVIDSNWRNRWRALLAVDDLVEALVATVDAYGKTDDTYVFFTSDHGFQLGQLNLITDKRRVYDFDTRIPLVVRGPGIRKRTIDALVTNVDFAPTFAQLAGLPWNDAWDGASLAPLLTKDHIKWRTSVPIEYFYWRANTKWCACCCPVEAKCTATRANCWCSSGDDCYETEDDRNNFVALRKIDHESDLLYAKYEAGDQALSDINFTHPHFRELFNTETDPWCTVNVHDDAPVSLLEALDGELDAWRTCSGEACRADPRLPSREAPASHAVLKAQVVDVTRRAFAHYKRQAWGSDELRPVSNVPHNWTQPALGVTLIDSMSTLWLLGLRDEFKEAADHVAASFDPLDIAGGRFVDVFETTIRVLGGLVGAYSLSGDERLLDAAETFADALVPALSASPSGIPFRGIASLRDGVVTPSTGATCGTAPAGTLLLEFRAVARLAGRPDLEALALRSWQALGKATGRVKGLAPSKLKMTPSGCAAQFVFGNQSKLTVGSGVDSYYEYLLKGWLQEGGGGRPPKTWSDAVDAVDANLVQVHGPITFMADIEKNKTLGNRATHLACFWPGLRALEAIADPQVASSVLPLAEKLLDACVAAYDATPTNLAPEAWHVNDDGSIKLGANLRHLLRPETIESVFWMYRATRKKQKWLDAATRLWAAFRRNAPVAGGGLATLGDVRKTPRPPRVDKMDSWVFSETLKYFYLIFDDADGGELLPLTEWVLTTEAHPVPRFGGPRDRVGTARQQKTWSIDVPSIGTMRPLPNETAADSVERFAQAADRAGHAVTEAAVQAWYEAAIDAGAPQGRPLGEALEFDVDVASYEDDEAAMTVRVPIYRAARAVASIAARQACKAGVARPAAIYKSLVKNICERRRCEARDKDPGKRASMYLQPAGHVVLEPWEWPPNALGAVARDLRATTGVVVDEGSFYRAVRWFCDRRAEGCRGARLQGDSSKTTYEAHSGKRSVEFSASPWDWPQTLGTDVAEELYKGETAQYRREGAEGIATKICKGNQSCAALPGASITLRLTTEAAPYTCTLREEPAGCVERAARAAKALDATLSDDLLRVAARKALRDLCAVRYCARALSEPVNIEGIALQPWDDTEEWARAHFKPEEQQRRARDFACRGHRYWCDERRTRAPTAAPVAMAAPDEDATLITRALVRAKTPPPPRVYFLHLHKCGGTSICQLARNGSTNGLNSPDRNCNLYGDGPRTLGQAGERGYANLEWEDDCAARDAYAKAANLQFLAVERWLDVAYVSSPDCRARFFFVTCLREPLARYRSHLAFEHVSEEDAVAWAEQLQVPRDDPIRRGTAVVDNFYVRSLLGREFFFGTDAGNVTLADAQRAKAVLSTFDAVLILERLDASLRQLYHRLGWCAASTPIHRHRSKEPPLARDAAAVDAFRRRNNPDLELYAFADRRLAAALEEDISLAPVRACATTEKPPAPEVPAATTARPVYFLHFQRSGGGSLCHIASQDNRLAAPPSSRTCALEGDGPKTLAPTDGNAAWATAEGCVERAAATSQYQFFAVERWFDLEYFSSVECRARFFFVTSLREPLTRIASHLAKVGASVEEATAWASRTHVETIGRGTAAVDNFYTRSLLGREAFHGIEAGNVTLEDAADRAFDVLKQFDAVVILERLAISFRQLASKLDWCLPATLNLCDLRPKHCPAYANLDEVRGAFGALNAPDAALYVKADRLAADLERDLPAPKRCTVRDEL